LNAFGDEEREAASLASLAWTRMIWGNRPVIGIYSGLA
jgi:hypothetical protein